MIKQNQKYLNFSLVALDIASIYLSVYLSWFIRFYSGLFNINEAHLPLNAYLYPIQLMIPVYIIIYSIFNLYSRYRFKNIHTEFFDIVSSNVLGVLILFMIFYLLKQIHYSRYMIFLFFINTILITTIQRYFIRLILRHIRKRGYNLKHSIMIGCSDIAEEFLKRTEKNRHWGYNVVGIFDDSHKKSFVMRNKRVIGSLSMLEQYLNENYIDEVIITLGISEYEKLKWVIGICEKSGVRTQIIPDYYKYIPARPYVEELDGLPIINIRHVPLDNIIVKSIKRMLDIIIAFSAVIVFLPVLISTAVAVKLSSKGPIIYKQERVGLNKKTFDMYKFRSMRIQSREEERLGWTRKNDPRKTKVGEFIRKTSIDELPQLFNVLRGNMSIVGPRPERPQFVEKFKEEIPKYMIKHQVRPGITGWAQVNGLRGDTSIEKRIEYDIYYIENWNLWFDIKILWMTIFKGFINKNAY